MKKSTAKIIYTLACTALLSATAAVCFVQKPQGVTAAADGQTAQTDAFVSPTLYEQYLPLENPADVAVCDDYLAIADGNSIFVFDKKDGIYRKYIHEQNADAPKNVVTKLQFDNAGNLYLLDSSTYLYVLHVKDLETQPTPAPTRTNFSCSTFALHGDWLYFSSVTGESQLSRTPLQNPDVSTATTLVKSLYSDPKIAFWNDELYYTNADLYLHKINPEESNPKPAHVYTFQSGVRSMNISEGVFSYSDADNTFHAYALADILSHGETPTPLASDAHGYKSLCAFGGDVYVVKNHAIRRFSLASKTFTDYEICNRSSAVNRLDGATESYLVGDTLLIADTNNDRISVYDVTVGEFETPIALTFDPTHLFSDGETVLAANSSHAILYDLSEDNYGQTLSTYDDFNGALIGGASVYGRYYFATENNFYYSLSQTQEQNENGETETGWAWTETKKSSTRYADLISADAYGYIYVASGNKLFRFTEEEFLSSTAEGEELSDAFPTTATQFLIDYEGGVYALNGNSVQTLDGRSFDLSTPVFYGTGATPVSFAFGVEENKTYVVYQENYILETEKFLLPTVKTVSAEKTAEEIYAEKSATVSVVRTKPNTLLIEFDLDALKGAEYFPYVSYERKIESMTALKIAETDKHAVLAFYDKTARKYSTYLALHSACEELAENEFREEYPKSKIGYLTNAVTLYKFPYLNGQLPVTALTRGAEISVLGEINELDNPYYHVCFTAEDGTSHTGYVPKTYVTLFNGEPPTSTQKTYGQTEGNVNAIWRLAYLTLGTLAIFILVDVLLLREEKEEDEEE